MTDLAPMAASRATETAASAMPAIDDVRTRSGTVSKRLPAAVESSSNAFASTQGTSPSRTDDRDSYAVTALADITDRSLHAAAARFTAGLSPATLAQAYLDWATHLTYSPGKRLQLVDKATRKAIRFANYASHACR